MGSHFWIVAFALSAPLALSAQEAGLQLAPRNATSILRCPDLSRFDEGAPPDRPKALTRLLEVLRNAPMGEAPARSLRLSASANAGAPIVVARGTTTQIAIVQASLGQLERSDPGTSRLHFTVVTMPLAVATAHRLEPGRTMVTDEATWTGLLRDAVKAKGRVHNLPEVITGFLAPFQLAEATAKDTPDPDLTRVHGEVVPLDNGAIAVALELARKSRLGNHPTVLARPVFRLAAGEAAMMAALDGDRVVVTIARCIETGTPSK